MKTPIKKALSGLAVLAIAASVGPFLSTPTANAATAGTPPEGSLTMTPPTGDSQQDFVLDPDDPQVCPGDAAADGYRWQTFFVDIANDPATLTYGNNGPRLTGTTGFVSPLFNTSGSPVVNQSPDVGTAFISGIPVMDFAAFEAGVVPAGEYYVGIACTLVGETETFWQLPITITTNAGDGAANIDYAVGTVDDAPVLSSVTTGDSTLTAEFAHTASDPANTTYTATATPTGSGAAVTGTGTASPITIGGLANGTEYSVTVRASNLAGDSPESNAEVGTPAVGAQPPVQNLTVDPGDPGSTAVSLDWDAPAGGLTPTGYTVAIDPAEGTVTVNDADTSAEITGLTSGASYECTVTPTYSDATATATPATVDCTPTASGVTILQQNVTVTRPAGALVFTQRCEDTTTGTPLPGATWSDAPCAIAFGVATRVLEGPNRGKFFVASATLNNVQVDSFGDDTGWNVTGDISDEFVADSGAANQRFSGNQLGWTPIEVSKTDGLTVELGDAVTPGTPNGLTASPRLASSPAGSSLGIAELDADLSLLIPVQARAGDYSATLTMTAMPTP